MTTPTTILVQYNMIWGSPQYQVRTAKQQPVHMHTQSCVGWYVFRRQLACRVTSSCVISVARLPGSNGCILKVFFIPTTSLVTSTTCLDRSPPTGCHLQAPYNLSLVHNLHSAWQCTESQCIGTQCIALCDSQYTGHQLSPNVLGHNASLCVIHNIHTSTESQCIGTQCIALCDSQYTRHQLSPNVLGHNASLCVIHNIQDIN